MTPSYAAQLYWGGRGGKTHALLRSHFDEEFFNNSAWAQAARKVMEGDGNHIDLKTDEIPWADSLGDRDNYPLKLAVDPNGNQVTLHYIQHLKPMNIAEIGIYEGDTAIRIAKMMQAWNGGLHVFDYHDRINAFMQRLADEGIQTDGYINGLGVRGFGNSYKYQDSYNWNLAHALRDGRSYDYVFIDGAHTWNVDALTFLLVDRLLNPGGIVDFDDYDWTVMGSPSLNPEVFPRSAQMMTEEQMQAKQVKMVVNLLVRRDPRYVELFPNKIFRKVG